MEADKEAIKEKKWSKAVQGTENGLSDEMIKNSVLGAMLIIVFSLCFVGAITFFVGLAMLDNGIYMSSINYYADTGYSSAEILKGSINILIGVALLFGSYGFVMYTVERKEWWRRLG